VTVAVARSLDRQASRPKGGPSGETIAILTAIVAPGRSKTSDASRTVSSSQVGRSAPRLPKSARMPRAATNIREPEFPHDFETMSADVRGVVRTLPSTIV
jgi:hypothetical protein